MRRGWGSIAVQTLTITLQSGPSNPYDAASHAVHVARAVTMDDTRIGHPPPATTPVTLGQSGVDSTFDLVERSDKNVALLEVTEEPPLIY